MKSKTEQKLDTEFERMGLRPRIYHFTTNVTPFNAITIAHCGGYSWSVMKGILISVFACETIYWRAGRILNALRRRGIYGVAICDSRDSFNRQRGRIIAKGRLLKYLKEVTKQ